MEKLREGRPLYHIKGIHVIHSHTWKHSCHVSLASFHLEQHHNFFSNFLNVGYLKIISQFFCRILWIYYRLICLFWIMLLHPHVLWCMYVCIPLSYITKNRISESMNMFILNFVDNAKLFSKVIVPIYNPLEVYVSFSCSKPLSTLWC